LEISPIPRHLANFKDFGNFPKCLGICEIFQKSGNLENSSSALEPGEFPK